MYGRRDYLVCTDGKLPTYHLRHIMIDKTLSPVGSIWGKIKPAYTPTLRILYLYHAQQEQARKSLFNPTYSSRQPNVIIT